MAGTAKISRVRCPPAGAAAAGGSAAWEVSEKGRRRTRLLIKTGDAGVRWRGRGSLDASR